MAYKRNAKGWNSYYSLLVAAFENDVLLIAAARTRLLKSFAEVLVDESNNVMQ